MEIGSTEDYEIAVSILGAILKNKEHVLKPEKLKNISSNKWTENIDE